MNFKDILAILSYDFKVSVFSFHYLFLYLELITDEGTKLYRHEKLPIIFSLPVPLDFSYLVVLYIPNFFLKNFVKVVKLDCKIRIIFVIRFTENIFYELAILVVFCFPSWISTNLVRCQRIFIKFWSIVLRFFRFIRVENVQNY